MATCRRSRGESLSTTVAVRWERSLSITCMLVNVCVQGSPEGVFRLRDVATVSWGRTEDGMQPTITLRLSSVNIRAARHSGSLLQAEFRPVSVGEEGLDRFNRWAEGVEAAHSRSLQ